jgi:hypothetical protein
LGNLRPGPVVGQFEFPLTTRPSYLRADLRMAVYDRTRH